MKRTIVMVMAAVTATIGWAGETVTAKDFKGSFGEITGPDDAKYSVAGEVIDIVDIDDQVYALASGDAQTTVYLYTDRGSNPFVPVSHFSACIIRLRNEQHPDNGRGVHAYAAIGNGGNGLLYHNRQQQKWQLVRDSQGQVQTIIRVDDSNSPDGYIKVSDQSEIDYLVDARRSRLLQINDSRHFNDAGWFYFCQLPGGGKAQHVVITPARKPNGDFADRYLKWEHKCAMIDIVEHYDQIHLIVIETEDVTPGLFNCVYTGLGRSGFHWRRTDMKRTKSTNSNEWRKIGDGIYITTHKPTDGEPGALQAIYNYGHYGLQGVEVPNQYSVPVEKAETAEKDEKVIITTCNKRQLQYNISTREWSELPKTVAQIPTKTQ